MLKKKQKKKNRILITLCSMFIAVVSVFSFVSFNNQDDLVVSADTVNIKYSYTGSDLYYFDAYRLNNFGFEWLYNIYFKTDLLLINDGIVRFSPTLSYVYTDDMTIGYQSCVLRSVNTTDNPGVVGDIALTYDDYNMNSGAIWYAFQPDFPNIDNGAWLPFCVSNNGNFNANVVSIRLFKSNSFFEDLPGILILDDSLNSLNIQYNDANGNSMTFSFIVPNNFLFNDRTYYITPDFTEDIIYQQGYANGVTTGYNDGYNKGNTDGYNNGYDIGHNVGYNSGYTAGAEDTNQYTFLNLVSATIDAPIKYFQSLFNFELLGVNLQGFLTGLFTLCVIVTIIKMVL